jgi:hypothetical protein
LLPPGGRLGFPPDGGTEAKSKSDPDLIERAFDYRGNTTVVTTDGAEIEGYVFNRNADAPEPFIQLFDMAGDGPITILYAAIRTIRFTGKDMAAGNSYEAWLRKKSSGDLRPDGDCQSGG